MRTFKKCLRKFLDNKANLALIFVIILAVFLRFYDLGLLPRGLNRDEAAIAYNALLLEQTGKDEWQRPWPISLESFGDYKLPGYPYLLAGLFSFLPTNDLVVRLPSALAGVGLVIVTYLLVNLLAKNRKIALFGATLVATNPIFIWYSRGAWEANVGLFLLILGAFLTIRRAVKYQKWTPLSLITIFLLLILSFLTYNAPLLIMAVLVFFLPWIFYSYSKKFFLPLTGITLLAVIVSFIVFFPVNQQKNGITIFSDPTIYHEFVIKRASLDGLSQKILGNQYVYQTQLLLRNTVASFKIDFWRKGGTHPWHQLSEAGHLSWITTILVYGGLFFLCFEFVKQIYKKRIKVLNDPSLKMIVVLLITLVPSVITTDAPHATRSLTFFFVLIMIAVYFLNFFHQKMRGRKFKLLIVILSVIVILESIFYFFQYCQTLNSNNLYRDGLQNVLTDDRPTLVVLTDDRSYNYVKIAWALKIPPEIFWRTLVRENDDAAGIKGATDLKNYHFFDDYASPWPNWQVVRYNTESNNWERLND